MIEVPGELNDDRNNEENNKFERKRDINLKKFKEALQEEKRLAKGLVLLYGCSKDWRKSKQKLEKFAREFKKVYKNRRKYQRRVWQMDFIEDERIQFGGKEQVLKLQESDYKMLVNKYLLTIAQALQIADNILNK